TAPCLRRGDHLGARRYRLWRGLAFGKEVGAHWCIHYAAARAGGLFCPDLVRAYHDGRGGIRLRQYPEAARRDPAAPLHWPRPKSTAFFLRAWGRADGRPTVAPAMRLLVWGLCLRCRRCGAPSLFRSCFAMHERCAVCPLQFERSQGYFVGAISTNIG